MDKKTSNHRLLVFLVGRNGDFDQCVSSSVLRVRKNYRDDNSALVLVLVLPYPTGEYLNNENYFRDYYTDVDSPAGARHILGNGLLLGLKAKAGASLLLGAHAVVGNEGLGAGGGGLAGHGSCSCV